MIFPKDQTLTTSPSFPKALAARDSVTTNTPPGLQGNKNGPPGPLGNQKGPPSTTPTTSTTTTTEVLASPTSQTSPSTTGVSSPNNSPTFSTPPTLTSSSTPSTPVTSVLTTSTTFRTSASARPSVESSTTLAVSTSSHGVSATFFPVETTMQTTFTSTSSTTAIQTGMVGTNQFKHGAASPGLKAGIAIGTIAGFAFILALIFLLFKRRGAKFPKLGTWGNSRWLSRSQTPDAMSDSLLTEEVGPRDSPTPTWDYTSTFARPTATEKARRPLRKSLTRHLWFKSTPNPLGLNPVRAAGSRTPSRKSFTSLFHRLSAASSHHSTSHSGGVMGLQSPPPLPPPYTGFLPPIPSVMKGEAAHPDTDTDISPKPPAMAKLPQIPPPAVTVK